MQKTFRGQEVVSENRGGLILALDINEQKKIDNIFHNLLPKHRKTWEKHLSEKNHPFITTIDHNGYYHIYKIQRCHHV